jgi:hypothetical protein
MDPCCKTSIPNILGPNRNGAGTGTYPFAVEMDRKERTCNLASCTRQVHTLLNGRPCGSIAPLFGSLLQGDCVARLFPGQGTLRRARTIWGRGLVVTDSRQFVERFADLS